MRLLITGSNGLLGQKLVDKLSDLSNIELAASSRGENRNKDYRGIYYSLDLEDPNSIRNTINEFKPTHILHGAAMTNVDQCELNHDKCWKVNVEAVRHMLESCAAYNSYFAYISTDFVFDGEKKNLYTETDQPKPVSYYGESKWEAEKLVEKYKGKWSILRTILVYGHNKYSMRSNIVKWARTSLAEGNTINVVDDQFRTPTWVDDLADGCISALQKEAEGIFHLGGKDYMSIIDLVRQVSEFYNLDPQLIKPTDSKSLNQPAKRPPSTGFDLSKSKKVLGYQPHSFKEGLQLMTNQEEIQKV